MMAKNKVNTQATNKDAKGNYASVNGLDLYYEIRGKVDAGWDGSGMSNARLAILPATTHYNIYSSPMLAAVVAPFLDAPMP